VLLQVRGEIKRNARKAFLDLTSAESVCADESERARDKHTIEIITRAFLIPFCSLSPLLPAQQ